MARKPSEQTTKVMDVSMPGKGKIVPTSRPVVSEVARNEVSTSGKAAEPIEEVKPLAPPSATRKVIQPIKVNDGTPDDDADKPELPIETISNVSDLESDETKPETAQEPSVEPLIEVKTEQTFEEPVTEELSDAPVAPEPTEAAEPVKDVSPVIEETLPKKSNKSSDSESPAESTDDEDKEAKTSVEEPAESDAPQVSDTITTPAEGSDSASVDTLADSVETKKDAARKAEEQAKKDLALDELIASRKYIVPIGLESPGTVHKNSHHGFMIITLLLILLAACGYLAIDAELLNLGIEVPYELIKS